MSELNYKGIVENMPLAFALHQMLYDNHGNAIDYIFLEVNREFELVTGLKASDIIGKRCLEVLPETEKIWFEKYDECIRQNQHVVFQNYSQVLNKYFQVTAYSPAPEQFIVLFQDVTNQHIEFNKSEKVASFFRSITENSTDAIVILSSENKFTYISPSVSRITGYELDDVENVDPNTFTHPDDLLYLLPELQKLLVNPAYQPTVSYRFRIKSGEWLWIESTFSNMFYNPEIQGLVINFRDITERKNYEKILIQNEAKYRLTQQFGGIGSWEYYVDIQQFWNSLHLRSFFGIDVNITDPVMVNAEIIASIVGYERVEQMMLSHLKAKKPYDIEFEIIRKCDGEHRILRSRAETDIDEITGGVVVRGIVMDITEEYRQRKQIQESEAKFRNLYSLVRSMTDTMPDMIWAKNLKNEYLYINKSMCDNLLFAENTQEPIGKTDMYFAQRERNRFPKNKEWHTFGEICADTDKLTIEQMKQMQFDEYGNVRGKFLFLDVHKAPLYNAEGNLIGVVGSARDITERKNVETSLHQKMQEMERFHKLTVNRELNMIELKKEINDLLKQLGKDEKYRIIEK